MTDLQTLLLDAGRAGAEPPAYVVDDDLARGRRALVRRRLRRGGSRSLLVAAAAIGSLAVVQAPGVSPSPTHTATRSAATAPIELVAYTGTQPEGYTVDSVPTGWEIQGVNNFVLTIAAIGDPDRQVDSFAGKLVVMLLSKDGSIPTTGSQVAVGSRSGVISHIDPSTIGAGETNTLACTLTRGTTPVALPECDGNIAARELQEGQHTFTVRATDSAGNVGPVASRTWRVDATGPIITITQTGGIVNPPTFSFTSNEPAALLCAFDAQPLRDCATLSTATLTRFTNHTIRVQGTDAFGNVGTASRTFFLGLFRTAPAAPSAITVASVLDQATAQSTGVPVALTTGANTAITRFVVTPAPGTTTAAGAAASKRLALMYRKTPKAKRRYRLHLNERRLRKALTPGRYRVEIRAVSPSNKLSHAKYKTFRVKR